MATISKIILPNNTQYNLQDKISGYTTNTGTVTSVTAGTGLKIGTAASGGSITTTGTINHINSVTAGTVGTSSATSGSTLAVPYITYDAQGHITATGTHTHTITGSGLQNLKDGNAYGSLIQGSVIHINNPAVYSYTGGYKDSDISYDGGFVIYPTIKTGTLTYVSTDNSNSYPQGKYQLTINSGSIHDIYINDMICFTEQVIGNNFVSSNDYSTFRITSIDYDTGLITLWTVIGSMDYNNVTDTTLNNTPIYIIDSLSSSAYYADYEIKDTIYSDGSLTANLSNINNDCHKITIAHGNGVTLNISPGDYFIDNSGLISIIVKVIDSTNFVTCILSETVGHNESDFTDFSIGRGCYYFKYIDGHGAFGGASQVGGYNSEADGAYSYAFGDSVIASKSNQYVIGKYNKIDTCGLRPINSGYIVDWIETEGMGISRGKYAFIIGNGTSHTNRSNALTVDWQGNLQIAGDLQDMDGNSLISGSGGGSSTGTEVHYVDVVKGTAPSSQKYTEFQFKERNGTLSSNVSNLAVFGVTADTNGDYRTYIRGYYPIANSSDSANITITTRPNGNNWIDLESWVNVLGGHLDICSPSSGVLGFRYGGAASATATITNTGGSELATNGNFSVGGNVSTNGKTSSTQAKAGAYITTSGNIHLTGDTSTGAKINFYFGKSTSVTTSIQEASSGSLNISGNVIVGASADTVSRGVNVRNSLGNVGLTVGTDGAHGLYSGTKGGFLLYATKDDNSTDPTLYIPRPTRIAETLLAKDYSGSIRQVATSYYTDGQRVAAFGAPTANALYIMGQWGTAGTTYAVKTVTVSSSDIRLKENIKDTEVEALPIINQIKVREFNWKDGKHQKIGVVADELQEIDECLAVGGGYDEDGCMNIKSVDTFYLTGYLTKGIQELSKENEKLKKQISILDAKISYLLDKTK